MRVWLGFDLGTQSIRGVAASETGQVFAEASQPLTSRRDGVRHEQNPEDWWRALVLVSRATLRQVQGATIGGLAVDGTSGTILLCDDAANPLTPALMYDDLRAADECQRANEVGNPVWQKLGYRMQSSWALPKLIWLLREHSGLDLPGQLAHQSDFITRRLAGCALATDQSNALKTGYDLLNERWPFEVFEELGIPNRVLPPVVRSGTAIGMVCPNAAAETGIPVRTPIIAGMTDGCAAQISAGALQPGCWSSVLGTTLVLKGVSAKLVRDPERVVYSHRSPDGNWFPGGASNTGAAILAKQFPGMDLNLFGERAAARGPVKNICYPLMHRGERFPFAAADAEGFVKGEIDDEISRFAAMLQGIGFVERLCFDYMNMLGLPVGGKVVLTGGGARNRYWRQLRANILGRPTSLPEIAEPAFGMAILAASHGRRVSEMAKQMIRICETIDPQPVHKAVLHDLYLSFLDELTRRGWLNSKLSEHARTRAQIWES